MHYACPHYTNFNVLDTKKLIFFLVGSQVTMNNLKNRLNMPFKKSS